MAAKEFFRQRFTFLQAELLREVGLPLLQQPDVVLQSRDVLDQDDLQDETNTPQRGEKNTLQGAWRGKSSLCCPAFSYIFTAEELTLMWFGSGNLNGFSGFATRTENCQTFGKLSAERKQEY